MNLEVTTVISLAERVVGMSEKSLGDSLDVNVS